MLGNPTDYFAISDITHLLMDDLFWEVNLL